jgi:hypothetical protein
MKNILISLLGENEQNFKALNSIISFKSFTRQVHQQFSQDHRLIKNDSFDLSKLKICQNPDRIINLDNISEFQEEFEEIYRLSTPAIIREQDMFWAIAMPLTPIIMYGTDPFYGLVYDENTKCCKKTVHDIDSSAESKEQKIRLIYALILERLYGFPMLAKNVQVFGIPDEKTNLLKYYEVKIDNSFVDVSIVGKPPVFDLQKAKDFAQNQFDWKILYEILPLSNFVFEGFSLLSVTDITAQKSLENIKVIIMERQHNYENACNQGIIDNLKILAENPKLEFGFLPALKINNKVVLNKSQNVQTIVWDLLNKNIVPEADILSIIEAYFISPKVHFYYDVDTVDINEAPFMGFLKTLKVKSFAMLPIFYNNEIVGALEVYSFFEGVLNDRSLSKLDGVNNLLGQLLSSQIYEFETQIEEVIKAKFTSIQPSVQWKFNEVAWQYLQKASSPLMQNEVIAVEFKNVFPLYGAIDIRNSTVERNTALLADLSAQLYALITVLTHINQQESLEITEQLIFKARQWEVKLQQQFVNIDNFQNDVSIFLEQEALFFLHFFSKNKTVFLPLIEGYITETNPKEGLFFSHRRALEASIQLINSTINEHLDIFKSEVQDVFPCYFEKFRTDGVEFDIYIGQSIAPESPFNPLYLKNIRLWQLTSIAKIAQITHKLLPELQNSLVTTQLIFIHSTEIDISFRIDERRFDVEGAYNIRYQILKKRIDKVHLLNSTERLTQPAKIAMVYSNPKEVQEYVGYIHFLQNKGILKDDLEYLDLEELQGVNGLKALRVGVVLGD